MWYIFPTRTCLMIRPNNPREVSTPAMLAALKNLFHRQPTYSHPRDDDDDSLDHKTLLPDPSSPPTPPKPPHQPHSSFSVALLTLLLYSLVYTSTGFWIVHSSLKAKTATDADERCMHLISSYCKPYSAKQTTVLSSNHLQPR